MDSLLDLGATIALYVFLGWVVLLALQASDLLATLVDMRGARDFRLKGRAARRRVTEFFWSIPVIFTLGLGFALGIDYAGRLIFDEGRERDGLIAVTIILFSAFAAGIAIVFALIRTETVNYAVLRENLREDADLRLSKDQLEAFRGQLDAVDAKNRRIRLGVRDRATMPRTRTHLRDTAERFRAVPPAGLQAFSAIGWNYAWAYIWRGNILRVTPALVIVVDAILLVVIAALSGEPGAWGFATLALVGVVVSSVLAVVGARASLAAKTAWHAVHLKQRTEVEDMLIELEKSSRKGVTGLGDRVAKALQILREQQQ